MRKEIEEYVKELKKVIRVYNVMSNHKYLLGNLFNNLDFTIIKAIHTDLKNILYKHNQERK